MAPGRWDPQPQPQLLERAAPKVAAFTAFAHPGRQTCLFSATLPSILADFSRARLHEPELIRLDLETKLSEALEITFFKV